MPRNYTTEQWLARDDESGMIGTASWEVGCSMDQGAPAVRVAMDDPTFSEAIGVGYTAAAGELRSFAEALLRHAALLEEP